MKKILISIFSCVLVFGFVSCSNDEEIDKSYQAKPIERVLSSDDAQLKAFKYLYLEGNQYTLKLSKKEAINLNISEKDYLNIINDIDAVNIHISKLRGDELEIFDLINPQKISDSYLHQALNERKLGALTKATRANAGAFSTNGQDWGYGGFSVPAGTSVVNITCNSVGFLQVFNVTAKTCGSTAYGGGTGVLGKWSTTLKVYCSGKDVYCTIGFKAANSNGGVCNYNW